MEKKAEARCTVDAFAVVVVVVDAVVVVVVVVVDAVVARNGQALRQWRCVACHFLSPEEMYTVVVFDAVVVDAVVVVVVGLAVVTVCTGAVEVAF